MGAESHVKSHLGCNNWRKKMMGFFNKFLDIALRAKIIATRNLANGSVNIVNVENDSTPKITVDVVREAIRRYNIVLGALDSASVEYKYYSIDKDEMIKAILGSLGDTEYVQTLLNEVKSSNEVTNDKRAEG